MSKLIDYLMKHSERGACKCGQCADRVPNPEQEQPAGHTADMIFFEVSAVENPDKEQLRELIREHKGEFCDVDLFDGKEHGYMELGGWIGDQGLALTLMGLGSVLGLWKLITPKLLLGPDAPKDLVMTMAGSGFLSIMATKD